MPLAGFTRLTLSIGLAITAVVITAIFSKDDDKRSDPGSSSRSSGTTPVWPSDQPTCPSYPPAHNQATTRTPAAPVNDRDPNRSSRISPHIKALRRRKLASARTEDFNWPSPPGDALGTHPTVWTLSTTEYDRKSHSGFDSHDIGEVHHPLSASAGPQAFHRPPLTPSRSQNTVKIPAATDHSPGLSHAPEPEPKSYPSFQAHRRHRSSSSTDFPRPVAVLRKKRTSVDLLSRAPASLSDLKSDKLAKQLRERARRCHREMCEARALAKSAHKRRDYQAESKHNEDAITHERKKKLFNEMAAKIIFVKNNKGHRKGTVDLHGLHVSEAVQYAEEEIKSASQRENGEVRFIVGKGLHCDVPGDVKIRPALEELCIKHGLKHSLDPMNTGVLLVQVG